jgi:hypothetical protein
MIVPFVKETQLVDVDRWLERAVEDVERRGLSEMREILEALADALRELRAADWNLDPSR